MTEEITPWILRYKSGREWANTLRSEGTKGVYFSRFRQYCDAVGKDPDELIAFKIEGLRNVTSEKEWQAEELLNNYLYNNNFTDSVKVAILTAVKSFYKANWRELNSNVGSNVSLPESRQRTPKMQELLELDDAMTTHRDRAILWLAESTAFRAGTITKLLWGDLQPTGDRDVPYQIIIESARLKGAGKGRYKGVRQISFIHAYAAAKLEKYEQELKEKNLATSQDSPVFLAYTHNRHNKGKGDRLKSLNTIFNYASLMAWRDLDAKRFSPHDLRDILQSALENAGVNPNIVSVLLAHKVKGVDQHYSSHDLEGFMQAFKKALSWLMPQTIEQVKAETQQKLAEEQKRLVNIEYENNELKGKVNKLTSTTETMQKQMFSAFGVETAEEWEKVSKLIGSMIRERQAKTNIEDEQEKAEILKKNKEASEASQS